MSQLEPTKPGGRPARKAYFNQPSNALWHSVNVANVSKKHRLRFILTSPDEDEVALLGNSITDWLVQTLN